MLQSIRDNSQSIVAKIIVGFIVLTFALWGVDSLVGLTTAEDAPITVNGVDISERQVQEGIEFQRRQILARLGDQADPSRLDDSLLRGPVVESLIEQELLIQSAQEQAMTIPDSLLDSLIVQTPEFQTEEGAFDRSRFEAMLRNIGLTPLMYRDLLRREKLIEQERAGLMLSAFSLAPEQQRLARLDRQTRDLQYLTLSLQAVEQSVTVSEAEVQARYRQQQGELYAPEQVAIQYLELTKAQLMDEIEVEESELRSQYQQLLATFEAGESRRAAHILLEFGEDEAAALSRAEALAERLEGGADFAELAREHSDDPASAELGGDLGFMERGVFVPEFEEVLYALEEGEISQPVRTEFGYHLIKLEEVERSEPPTFEAVRDRLVREVREQQAEQRFVERSERLADLSFTSGDLREPAEVLGLEIQESDFFGRSGGETQVTGNPRVVEAAFDPEVLENGNNSDLIELGRDQVVVLRVKEHRPRRPLELEEVRDELTAQIRREKAQAQLRAQGEALIERAEMAGSLAAIASEQLSWQRVEGADRSDQQLPAAVKEQAFRLPKPDEGRFSLGLTALSSGDLALVAVTGVESGTLEQLPDEQQQALERLLSNRLGQMEYQGLVENLKARAEIERL